MAQIIDYSDSTLLIPSKFDLERDAVAAAWENAGGSVIRVDKFWEPPGIDNRSIKLYGDSVFCLVLEEKLGLILVSPDDYVLEKLDSKWLKRKINIIRLDEINESAFPVLAKALIPKQFRSGVYNSAGDLMHECRGLSEETEILISEIVLFECDIRCFILNGQIMAIGLYEGNADVNSAKQFADRFISDTRNKQLLTNTYVLDIGYIQERGWAVIEINPSWGSGLNGCVPEEVIRCIYYATLSRG